MNNIGNTFDILDKYIDEHYDEIFKIISQQLNKYVTSATLFPYGDNALYPIEPIKFSIDDSKHMWYNTFNKWNWGKCENGVIKIADNNNR